MDYRCECGNEVGGYDENYVVMCHKCGKNMKPLIAKPGPSAKLACSDGLVLVEVDAEIAMAPIANALHSTGRFTTEECSDLAEGVLMFITDHDLVVAKKN